MIPGGDTRVDRECTQSSNERGLPTAFKIGAASRSSLRRSAGRTVHSASRAGRPQVVEWTLPPWACADITMLQSSTSPGPYSSCVGSCVSCVAHIARSGWSLENRLTVMGLDCWILRAPRSTPFTQTACKPLEPARWHCLRLGHIGH